MVGYKLQNDSNLLVYTKEVAGPWKQLGVEVLSAQFHMWNFLCPHTNTQCYLFNYIDLENGRGDFLSSSTVKMTFWCSCLSIYLFNFDYGNNKIMSTWRQFRSHWSKAFLIRRILSLEDFVLSVPAITNFARHRPVLSLLRFFWLLFAYPKIV